MKRNIILGGVVSLIVALIVSISSIGSLAKAFGEGGTTYNINVNEGGTLNLNVGSSDMGNLGYSVALTNSSDVNATFSNDVDVSGDLTAGTITSDGALAAGTTVTAGTNILTTDGILSISDSIATGTTNSILGTYTLTCSNKDEGGCDDGDVLTLISALMEVSDLTGTTGEEATSVLKMFVTLDDSATSSKEVSFTISGSADNTTNGDTVWQKIDSGNVIFPAGNLSVGTTTVAYTLSVDEATATTTSVFGSASSASCMSFYAGTNKTLYYFDPTATAVDDISTTTKPGWCS